MRVSGGPETAGGAADPPLRRVAVVGAGLVGGSVARAVRGSRLGRVVMTDVDPDVRDRARRAGVADEVRDTIAEAVQGAELVVIAIPTRHVPEVVEFVANCVDMQTIITDTSSLKTKLVPEVEDLLASSGTVPARFIGGHPMAGSEQSGPEAADGSLFQGATWVLTPTATTDDAALRRLSGFLSGLGARVLMVSPERHDRLVAVVSHLPQVAASCLADMAGDAVATSGQALLALAGGGFRDTTRVAASDPELWVGILEGNREAVLDALAAYRSRLDELGSALQRGDVDALRSQLQRASEARRQLVSKDGPREVVDLVVALADRPGELAVATSALGEAGVNIEDLAMRHAVEGQRGALLVRVDAATASRGLAALAEHGLAAHLERDEPAPVDPPPEAPGHR